MLILLSNDDGVAAQGINVLRRELSLIADVWVVAPDRERSAVGHAITLHRPLRALEVEEKTYSVDGTPTDAVILAVNKILPRKPDLVVSGINHGPNLGDDITYSGTVSAAMEGAILGFPSVAVSLAISKHRNFRAAACVARRIVEWVAERGLPSGVFLNVNVPDVEDYSRIKGLRWTRQGRRVYTDYIAELKDPRGNVYYWIGGIPVDDAGSAGTETDIGAVREGFVSVTPIRIDFTDYGMLERVRDEDIGL